MHKWQKSARIDVILKWKSILPWGFFSPKYCPNLSASSVQLSSIVQNFYPNKSKTYNSFPSSGGLCWEPTFSLWYMKLPCLQARFMRQDSVKSLFQGWREDKTKFGWPCVPQRPKQKIFLFTKLNSPPNLFRLHYRSNQVQLSTKSEIARQIDNDYSNVAQNESTIV